MRSKPAPGAAARQTLGLQQFPAAGKTGTAYDFTEALFAGYDSAITVAVRVGFDKPQKIYRGAFGSEIALPVWVDMMNTSVARYPAKEFKKPAGIQSVEICSKSGLLATDKCPSTTTYREIATKEQMPTDPCTFMATRGPGSRVISRTPASRARRSRLIRIKCDRSP